MAKLNLKKLLLSSCFSAILFLSCEKEFLEEEHSNHESNIKKTKVNFNDFKENQKAFDVFKKLNLIDSKSTNKNSAVQNSNSYDFEINFNNGIHLSYHDLESYTFPIRRDVDNGLLENIVISEHTDGKYYAKLLKYNLTTQERIDLGNEELKSVQNPIVTEVLGEYTFGNQIQSDCGYITITTITSCVNGHTSPSQCNLTGSAAPQIKTVTIAIACDTGSSGGGGTGDGSGGYYGDPFYGGGGSGGGGYITPEFPNDNTPTDLYEDGISEPVLDIGDGTNNETTINHISKLKEITSKTNIKNKIIELKNKCTNPNQFTEDGAQYIKSGKNYNERPPSATSSDETRFDPPFVPNVEVVIHMHELKTYIVDPTGQNPPELVNIVPVFSNGDIYAFLGLAEYTNFSNANITAIVVTPAGTFAMRVDNFAKMQEAATLLAPIGEDTNGEPIDSPDMKKLTEEYKNKVIDICGDTDNACFTAAFTNFINTFTLSNGQTLGIGYYQATFDTNDIITNWTKQQ